MIWHLVNWSLLLSDAFFLPTFQSGNLCRNFSLLFSCHASFFSKVLLPGVLLGASEVLPCPELSDHWRQAATGRSHCRWRHPASSSSFPSSFSSSFSFFLIIHLNILLIILLIFLLLIILLILPTLLPPSSHPPCPPPHPPPHPPSHTPSYPPLLPVLLIQRLSFPRIIILHHTMSSYNLYSSSPTIIICCLHILVLQKLWSSSTLKPTSLSTFLPHRYPFFASNSQSGRPDHPQ